jgi:hypothetical protein
LVGWLFWAAASNGANNMRISSKRFIRFRL